jgi:hypothetical protein
MLNPSCAHSIPPPWHLAQDMLLIATACALQGWAFGRGAGQWPYRIRISSAMEFSSGQDDLGIKNVEALQWPILIAHKNVVHHGGG